MACINCKRKINFFNKPMFGYGKLKDGSELCQSCFKIITKTDRNLTFKLKEYTFPEIKELLTNKINIDLGFQVKITSTSTESKEEIEKYEAYAKKYPKWFADENMVGICYKSERITPLNNGQEEIVHYKTDRYANLFGRGKDCSYFPGYGKIYNRTFEIWYQDFGTKEKQNIFTYKDIGANLYAPYFTEELTEGWPINNQLERTQGFKRLYNVRVVKTRKIWYAGLIEQEFTGIITAKELE